MTTQITKEVPPRDCELRIGVAYDRRYLRFAGWAIPGHVEGGQADGYAECHYWDNADRFRGPDQHGIAPRYNFVDIEGSTTTQTTHTPLPWKSQGTNPPMISGADDEAVCQCDGSVDSMPRAREAANAAFIVRAVNSHYDLLAALRVLVDHAQETYPHFESERGQRDIKAALDAIAKAERGVA